jgi:hypothetical protein
VYAVNRPLHVVPTQTAETLPFVTLAEVPKDPEAEPESLLIVLPTVEIIGKLPPVHVTPPRAQPHRRDISEMHCSAWRPLEQGSNSVQICD